MSSGTHGDLGEQTTFKHFTSLAASFAQSYGVLLLYIPDLNYYEAAKQFLMQ